MDYASKKSVSVNKAGIGTTMQPISTVIDKNKPGKYDSLLKGVKPQIPNQVLSKSLAR